MDSNETLRQRQDMKDRRIMNELSLMLGTSPEWSPAADFLEDIANLVAKSGRPHPGDRDEGEYERLLVTWMKGQSCDQDSAGIGARRFHLVRHTDVTGISGTGVVAEGVRFTDGTTVVRWLPAGTARPHVVRPTTVVHDSVESVIALHGHGGATVVEWIDPHQHFEELQPFEEQEAR